MAARSGARPALGGVRGTPATLLWLVLIPVFVTGHDLVAAGFDGLLATVVSLAFGAVLWTLAPFFLVARRLDWHFLVPAGVITALGMSLSARRRSSGCRTPSRTRPAASGSSASPSRCSAGSWSRASCSSAPRPPGRS
jgi:hypothetical protein